MTTDRTPTPTRGEPIPCTSGKMFEFIDWEELYKNLSYENIFKYIQEF